MSKYGFLSVLEEELDKHFSYDFAIDWDKKNHSVEVSFVLEAGLPEGVSLEDSGADDEGVALEEFVLFYHPDKSSFDPEDYLVALPFDPKKGLSRQFLSYFAQFLQATADQGMDDLLDFLADDTADEFAMVWNADEFEQGRDEFEETEWYGYPRY
ncbi:DUF3013 family protein [Streptococcus sp. E24BD]|uniref:DUF3013 family protein n=1 Tax=Streptococcus sp. E24BD TaxID=3278715 RepID=UPI00359E945E